MGSHWDLIEVSFIIFRFLIFVDLLNLCKVLYLKAFGKRQYNALGLKYVVIVRLTRNTPRIGYWPGAERVYRLTGPTCRELARQTPLLVVGLQYILFLKIKK